MCTVLLPLQPRLLPHGIKALPLGRLITIYLPSLPFAPSVRFGIWPIAENTPRYSSQLTITPPRTSRRPPAHRHVLHKVRHRHHQERQARPNRRDVHGQLRRSLPRREQAHHGTPARTAELVATHVKGTTGPAHVRKDVRRKWHDEAGRETPRPCLWSTCTET